MTQKKILIVEDDADQRLALSVRLRSANYSPVFASDGVSAVGAAQRERPDMILLDLGLPGGDGYVVLDRIKAIPHLASIPIAVITARTAEENREKSLNKGVQFFLRKPVENHDLLSVIKAAIGE